MIKLIACDMDGTLLDSAKRLPAELPDVIAKLKEKGVLFCVASGRQYASLRRDFDAYADDMLFICENGALVMQRDQRVLIDPIDPSFISGIVTAAKSLEGVYPVVCRAGVALIEKTASDEFIRNTRMYYPSVEVVADLTAPGRLPDVCKVAFYDEGDAQTHELPVLQAKLEGPLSITLSGEHWVDVMKPGVNKGCAMRARCESVCTICGGSAGVRRTRSASPSRTHAGTALDSLAQRVQSALDTGARHVENALEPRWIRTRSERNSR